MSRDRINTSLGASVNPGDHCSLIHSLPSFHGGLGHRPGHFVCFPILGGQCTPPHKFHEADDALYNRRVAAMLCYAVLAPMLATLHFLYERSKDGCLLLLLILTAPGNCKLTSVEDTGHVKFLELAIIINCQFLGFIMLFHSFKTFPSILCVKPLTCVPHVQSGNELGVGSKPKTSLSLCSFLVLFLS